MMFRGFVALMLSTGMRLLTSMVVFIIMAKAWGAAPFGQFMYVMSVSTLLTLICEFGFTQQILKEVGGNQEKIDDLLSSFSNAKLFLTIGTWCIATIFAWRAGFTWSMASMLFLLLAANTFLSYADFYLTFIKARALYERETVVTVLGNAVLFGLSIVAIYVFSMSPLMLSGVFMISRGTHLVMALQAYKKYISPQVRFSVDMRQAGGTIRKSIPYGVDVAVGAAFANVDGVLVTNVLGYAANGIYQAAARFYQGVSLIPPLFAGLFLPRLAQHISKNEQFEANALTRKMYIGMIAAGAMAMVGFFAAESFFHLIYRDPELAQAAKLMPLFGVLVLIRFIAAAQGITVTVLDGQAVRSAIFIVCLLILVGAGIGFLRMIGLPGIILAASLAYLVLSLSFWLWTESKGHSYRKIMLISHLGAMLLITFCCGRLVLK